MFPSDIQDIFNGTVIGPLKGSESGTVGKANGSTGTGRKWKPYGVAFLYQVDPCRIKTKIIVRIKCIILLFIESKTWTKHI